VRDWINKLLGRATGTTESSTPPPAAKPSTAPPAEAAPWLARLREALAPLDRLPKGGGRPGLAADLLSYVTSGQPPAVVNELWNRPAVAEHLGLTGSRLDGLGNTALYEQFAAVPVALQLRWAQLLDASVTNDMGYALKMGPNVHWPEALLLHATGSTIGSWSPPKGSFHLTAALFEPLLVAAGLPASSLVTAAFATEVEHDYRADHRLKLLTRMRDFGAAIERHAEVVAPLVTAGSAAQRLHSLHLLQKMSNEALGGLAPQLCELAVSGHRQVRVVAETLVRRGDERMATALRELATSGKPEPRGLALRLLWKVAEDRGDDGLRDFARRAASADKAASVRALLDEWQAASAAEQPAVAPTRYEYEVPIIAWATPTSAELTTALDTLWQQLDAGVERANEQARQHQARMKTQGHKVDANQQPPFDAGDRRDLAAYLASTEPKLRGRQRDLLSRWGFAEAPLRKLAEAPGVTPVALLKTLVFFNLDRGHQDSLFALLCQAFNAMHRATGRPSLLELAEMLAAVGHPARDVLGSYCTSWGAPLAVDWPADAVWPFFAHHLDELLQQLDPTVGRSYWFDRGAIFRALGTLPTPPATVVDALFGLALGNARADRVAAQQALAKYDGKEARLIAALADSRAEVRTVAAQWVGRLRLAAAQPALEAAVAKEKQDLAKGALLDALLLLGHPVERYLDRDALAAEAAKGLQKGTPADLAWFPWNALPAVRWADTGAAVPTAVLQWLLVQAYKQKSAEPNALLRKYCGMFEPNDRESFGQLVLEAWLREDVRPIPPDEAASRAATSAQQTWNAMQRWPQYYQNDPKLGRSVDELTAYFLPGYLRLPASSAIATKGLLAVAAACAGQRAAGPVGRYLKEYYGTRAAQGRALIVMLAWIEHPSATQLMLAIGSRFRTKSFQEEATRQAEALADRRGWSLAELADRTMPSAGFDETGTLDLAYGLRTFTAKLLPDFKVELFNAEGKKIAALPEPRQDDDAELAGLARKAFSAAKKEIKSIVDLQSDRLYEALCTEREWSFADWDGYLNRHPIVRRLVQRLVWVEVVDGQVVQSFRPLDDGTLTDRDDNEVTLASEARVRLAHDSLLPPAEVQAWQQHLADYQVTPLFQQLGKGVYGLPAKRAQDTRIADFEGHLLMSFALRSRAQKLGYTRGPAEDGGWFHVYEKRFPTLALAAVVGFTGSPLPEENRQVALLELTFARLGEGVRDGGALALGQVPKVLLSECWNDLRLLAAEGTGFDPEWEKKAAY
jgi:hypothetical protein